MKRCGLVSALAVVALLWLPMGALAQVTVSNLVVAQRPGTKLVDIQYDVSSSVTSVYVSLSVSNSGVPVNAISLSGNLGNVAPGTGRSIVWNMGTDWNGNVGELTITLTAEITYKYLVLNLAGGPSATNYPVSYFNAIPGGGWTTLYKTTNLVLQRISEGVFTMGSPTNELGRSAGGQDETRHQVTLTKAFYVGIFEVTQKQWERVVGTWPSYFSNTVYRDSRPVETVTYNDIRGNAAGSSWPANNNVDSNSFMGLLRTKTDLPFDLPTEAQWEYACRAGTTTALNSGNNLTNTSADSSLAAVARYYWNGGLNATGTNDTTKGSARVGSYQQNSWGLYDMHGNAWEWCLDWYGNYSGAVTNPPGALSGSGRLVRGGGWGVYANQARSAQRMGPSASSRNVSYGLRVTSSHASSHTATVNALMDSRDYKLEVVSNHGSPSPPTGTNIYAWGSWVTCSVAQISFESGIEWHNTGWAGTGSIPVTGTTNTSGPVGLSELSSSIIWHWAQQSNFTITNVVATQRPGTKLMDITYDIVSDITNAASTTLAVTYNGTPVPTNGSSGDIGASVVPGSGKAIVWDAGSNWNGSFGDLIFAVKHASETQYFSSCRASVDSRDYALKVVSVGESISPPTGTNLYPWRASVICSVAQTSVVSGIKWRNTGWTGTGSIPASGTSNTTSAVVLTDLVSMITWNWETSFGGITNAVAAQRPGTKLVDITYDIVSDVTNGVPISLAVSQGGTPVPTNGATGNIGASVLPGSGKVIVWDAGSNWNGNVATLVFSVGHSSQTQFVSSSSCSVDSRSYTLTVNSAQAAPSPPVGTNTYAWRASVTCSVARTSLVSGVNWRCIGWTGTGSILTSGATNTTGAVILTNPVSSIIWNWQTSFAVTNVVAVQQPGTKTINITYDIVSDVTNGVPIALAVTSNGAAITTNGLTGAFGANVLPGSGKAIVWSAGTNWNGNMATLVFSVRHSSQTQFVSSGSCAVDSRDYRLTVDSPRGSPAPPAGTNLYAWRASVTCSVARTTLVSGVNWRCAGWSGSGSVMPTGTTNTTGLVVLSNVTSAITWNWTASFAIANLAASQRPGTKLVDITFDIVSDIADLVPITLIVTSNGAPVPTTGITGDFGSAVSPGAGKAIVWDAGANWNGNAATLLFAVRHSSQTQFVSAGSCAVDSRDYTLTVTSVRGAPTPAAGSGIYSWGASVVCSDVQTSFVGGVKWRNTGWTGTGSIPALGVTNTTGTVVLTNPASSITWNWEPWFVITNITQRPGTKLVDIQYDISSLATNFFVSLSVSNAGVLVVATNLSGHVGNVVPGIGKSILWNMGTDWNGNVAELSFTLIAQPPDYIVVDLSVGPAATNYPVSYLAAVPGGGWTDRYKTTNMVLRRIPAGAFIMGSPTNELGRTDDETQHSVTLTKDYYIGVFEVTQKQWERAASNWPNYFTNATYRDSRPVEQVSYIDIRGTGAGTNWPANNNVDTNSFMGLMRSKTGLIFDLPTEAQWEFACRAGITNALNSGYNLTNIAVDARMAEVGRYWYNGGSNYTANGDTSLGTAKVGSYLPNAWGLYDIHGNAWEWCLDWYGAYPATGTDPKGAVSGSNSVVRGGSLYSYAYGCRSACRGIIFPGYRGFNFGFRVSLPASQTATASSVLDSRDYKLTVISARATPSPAVGTNIYAWRASVTCSVARTSLVSGVNWSNLGWTGTGSIPASGVTTNTGPVVLTNIDSTITWNWGTSFAITNLAAVQRAGTNWVDITYDILSDVTNGVPISLAIDNTGNPVPTNGSSGAVGANILPGPGKAIAWNAGSNWNGNAAQLTFYVRHSSLTQFVASGAFPVYTRAYALTVVSVRGSPSPSAGTYSNYSWRSTVTASVQNVAGYTMTGWSGTGSVPATGSTNSTGAIILTDLVSSVTWNWTTNTYTVSFDAQGGSTTVPTSKVVTYSLAYGVLPTTTREFYNFTGWWTASAGGANVTSNTTVSMASNHTLYARWAIYTYPVILHPGLYGRIVQANSNADYVANIAHGSPFPTVTIVPYAGYSFTGWNPAAPGTITTNYEATAQYAATSAQTYDVGAGPVTITNNGNYIITGSTLTNTITVVTGIQANITLINVSVVLSNGCAFHIGGGANISLTLLGKGTNTFSSCDGHAGIHLASNSVLSVVSNSTATLIAQGGAGGAGIGGGQGGSSGTIQIHGGTIQASGGANAAGVGGGANGASASVVIDGNASVTATGGDFGSGIGCGNGGTSNAVGIGGTALVQAQGGASGAGIGGGLNGGGGTILIGSNATTVATGGIYGAGIGGGQGGSGGNITVGGKSIVTGTGGDLGAGIGGGLSGAGGNIQIGDSSSVVATGTSGGAGLGGGFGGAGGTVTITWGTITATADGCSAIGAGFSGSGGIIVIGTSATVTAGQDAGSAVVVASYNGEPYTYIIHGTPELTNLAAIGSNLVFRVDTNGYSGFIVEGANLILLPNGAWNWQLITNFGYNPDGSIFVPMDGYPGEIIRLKLER